MRGTWMRSAATIVVVMSVAVGCGGDGEETAGDAQSPVTLAPSSTTTSTTSTTSTSTSTSTSTTTTTSTTTVAPELETALSDVLGAYDLLFDEPELGYAMLTETESSVVGGATSLQTGVWIGDVGTEITIVIELDPDTSQLVKDALTAGGVDGVVADQTETSFSDGFRYRFIEEDEVWFRIGTGAWTLVPLDGQTEVEQLRPLGDPTVYLDSFFDAIIDVTDIAAQDDGTTTYQLMLEADVFVPVVAAPTTSQNIYDRGWNGLSGAIIEGSVTLDASGKITAVSADQTPWWEAGWDAVGVLGLMGSTDIAWSLQLTTSVEPLDDPCPAPVPEPDPTVGEVLVCR